ncbi:MAG: hypothetical protein A2832_01815 [Candidatus Zambryskibacteria bacterium RIFCSPHIGHO2_01_FULL_44_22b]|uniref:General secretion pathway GspH domain-containing protein n=2 Tax=Candidatus Zambryskiibacteriota TaxID=1817925 RepID=A0A1G2SYD7_9BACT|nr:MAG: hypothetical protein A2832_01815 [Candidatus Zambryskibacteria bacterium RIFCSPHIGHO2_01_FULL_44_22b]OHB05882.1 MAG: hypothetical protein A3B16_01220 [Candidatus Zambryskibacteria bacterium RIFCSPLOWO2_01_FULL_45_43]
MKNGFTIFEILFAVAILGIAITIVSLSFSNINQSTALEKSVDTAISVFNEARSLTLASKDRTSFGVRIEPSQLILVPTDTVTIFNNLVGIRNISIAGGTTVTFKRLTGATDNFGTFEIYLKNATTTYRTITISATGITQ